MDVGVRNVVGLEKVEGFLEWVVFGVVIIRTFIRPSSCPWVVTKAPSFVNISEAACPIPEVEPVTMTTFPVKAIFSRLNTKKTIK